MVERVKEYYGWLTICDRKKSLIEKRVRELRNQSES
jgi:hypothetical protein